MITIRQLDASLPLELLHVLPENGAGDAVDEMAYTNNDFFWANVLEDQAQWRDKTKELSKLVIVKQCVGRQWMDRDATKVRAISSIREIRF